jgi:hypothetical protein
MTIITFDDVTQINNILRQKGLPCKVVVYERPEGQECHFDYPRDWGFDRLIVAVNEVECFFRRINKPIQFSGNGRTFRRV